jgi:hypothetical protein
VSTAPRVTGRKLAPWEQLPYFQAPKITSYPNIGANFKAVDANPLRCALIFAASGTTNIFLLPSSLVSTSNGIELVSTNPWIVLLQSEVGPLVQAEWWAGAGQAGANLTVIETLFAKWPDE